MTTLAPYTPGDLVEVRHECWPRDCYYGNCEHARDHRACPEPRVHVQSLRVRAVNPTRDGRYLVRTTSCMDAPHTHVVEADGLPAT